MEETNLAQFVGFETIDQLYVTLNTKYLVSIEVRGEDARVNYLIGGLVSLYKVSPATASTLTKVLYENMHIGDKS